MSLEREAAARALLSPRQLEAVGWAAQGMSNAEIAAAMGVSLTTVKVHLTAVNRALRVTCRTSAVVVTGLWRLP